MAYVGPLGAAKPRTVKLDLATDEYVESIDQRAMLPGWADLPEPVPFDVYPVGESGAEKLRCIIQRVQCRDLYDLFRLTEDVGVERYKTRWDKEMSEHVTDPPRFDDVVRFMRRHLRAAGLFDS